MFDAETIEKVKSILFSSLSKKMAVCVGVYFGWTFAHYISTLIYARVCTPFSFYGFVLSAVLVSTPQCFALRWVIYNGAIKMNAMLLLIGGYILAYVEEKWFVHEK